MVYTRSSSNVTTVARAAAALLALRSSSTKSNEAQFWTNWTNWYHTFVSEVQDEMRSGAYGKGFNRFAEAETRWAIFCANKLRCDVEQVQSWLKHSDVNARMSLAGY
jgi:hypothetical protein